MLNVLSNTLTLWIIAIRHKDRQCLSNALKIEARKLCKNGVIQKNYLDCLFSFFNFQQNAEYKIVNLISK